MGEGQAERCALCHSEHKGAGFAIVNQQSFAQAGTTSDAFDHSMIGFEMGGAHLKLQCRDCHENASVPVLPRGQTRFLGLDQNCAGCHEDVHEGRMKIGCAKCHSQEAFDVHGSLGHEEFLHLSGGHADVECRTCHANRTPHSLEAIGAQRGHPRRECVDCHESPHQEDFSQGVAALAGMSLGGSCIVCHEADHQAFGDERLQVTPEQHARSGFPLDAPHDGAECESCHAESAEGFAVRYPGRGADQCYHCHESPHGDQFNDGPFAEKQCVACHDRLAFEPHAFTTEKHERAALSLSGRHLELECEVCHRIPAEGRPRVFRGTDSQCAGCHEDAHRGYFDSFASELGTEANGTCTHCHGTTSFSEIPSSGFDHGRWTGFVIEGAHAQSKCEVCHKPSAKPDKFGRTFGRVREHFGEFKGCITCHRDPHEGDFDKEGLPQEVDGEKGCARCHAPTSFRAFDHGFDHGLWTGFVLDGRHAEIGCGECHEPLHQPDESGRTWARAAGNQCSACHEDSHNRQFERFGRTDCRRCHRTAVSFCGAVFQAQPGLAVQARRGPRQRRVLGMPPELSDGRRLQFCSLPAAT